MKGRLQDAFFEDEIDEVVRQFGHFTTNFLVFGKGPPEKAKIEKLKEGKSRDRQIG